MAIDQYQPSFDCEHDRRKLLAPYISYEWNSDLKQLSLSRLNTGEVRTLNLPRKRRGKRRLQLNIQEVMGDREVLCLLGNNDIEPWFEPRSRPSG